MNGFEMPPRIIATSETQSSEMLEQKEAKEQQELVREWGNRLQLGFDAMVDFDKARQVAEEITDPYDKAYYFTSIALDKAQVGLDSAPLLTKANQIGEEIVDEYRMDQKLRFAAAIALAEAQSQVYANLDSADAFIEARKKADDLHFNSFARDVVLKNITLAEAQSGFLIQAKQNIEDIKTDYLRSEAFVSIAVAESKAGLDPQDFFLKARNTLKKSITATEKSKILVKISLAEVQSGLFNQSKQLVDEIPYINCQSQVFAAIALAETQAGLDPTMSFTMAEQLAEEARDPETFTEIAFIGTQIGKDSVKFLTKARQIAEQEINPENRVAYFTVIASVEVKVGLDSEESFMKAKKSAEEIKDKRNKSKALTSIALAESQAGLFKKVIQTAEKITIKTDKSEAFSALALAEGKEANLSTLHELPRGIQINLLHQNNPKTLNALGYFFPEIFEDEERINSLPSETQASLKLGKAYKEQEALKESNAYDKTLANIAFTDDTKLFNRALSINLVHHDYETVSGILLQKINNAKTNDASKIRLLKTLLEIDNPKGQSLATTLFTNQHLSPRIREYVAKKLLVEDAWDKNLIPVLAEDTKQNKEAVSETLVSMIKDLGLTPDFMSYEALKQPGILIGETLEERVSELKSLREIFSKLSLNDLREKLQDERMRKIYYLVKGGEYRYTLINNYSFEKFALILDKINEQEVDDEVLVVFQNSLQKAGLTSAQSETIITSLKAGKLPLRDMNTRTFSFEAAADLGSGYELALNRLQEVWGRELQALALASEIQDETERSKALETIEASLAISEGKSAQNEKTQRILDLLQSQEKQDYKSIQKIAELIRKDLLQSAKQKNDKNEVAEIGRLNTHGLFQKYLSDRLPNLKDTFALSEWESHLSETLTTLETGPVQGKTKQKRFELTFLDKGADFVRALRFADGQQCCFNSGNYKTNGEQCSADWVARLNADPLSFIIDLKQEGSKIVSGFVFGRMGIDPDSGKPVVMLNGIYSQDKGGAIERNILKLIEDQFATMLHADSLVLASKHGGKLASAPTGYDSIQRDIQAVRALKDNQKVYDDIGNVGNGVFSFEGYGKKLA